MFLAIVIIDNNQLSRMYHHHCADDDDDDDYDNVGAETSTGGLFFDRTLAINSKPCRVTVRNACL
jgi:hypothetical protein